MSNNKEPQGVALTVGEARLVAEQIRQSGHIDRQYWPWVIEELCRLLEASREQNADLLDSLERSRDRFLID